MLTTTKPRATDDLELFDQSSLAAELDGLAKQHGSNEQALRRAIMQPLKNALATGRAGAERLLLQDRQGRRCAERLCQMHDDMSSESYANSLTYDADAHVEMVEQENKLAAEFPAQWREWRVIQFQMMKLAERLQEIR